MNYKKLKHEGWHFFWDYGGGELSNWGIHHLDSALWALGLDNVLPIFARGTSPDLPAKPGGYECPGHSEFRLQYPDGTEVEIVTNENETPATNRDLPCSGEKGRGLRKSDPTNGRTRAGPGQ